MKFTQGQFVQLKIDGIAVMILEAIKYKHDDTGGAIDGYWVRVQNEAYDVLKVAEFELQERVGVST